MGILITSDIHLTSSSRDEYRWGLFPFLTDQIKLHDVRYLLILGDLTAAKDNHEANLVNRIVENFTSLTSLVEHIYIIKGNHDYIEKSLPFFSFLSKIPKLTFLIKPFEVNLNGLKCLFLPNTLDYQTEWKGIDFNLYDYIYSHQTYTGAMSEYGEGVTLTGIPPAIFDGISGRVISGDIHKPQIINKYIKYVGSPFSVRCGDNYDGRILLINGDKSEISIPFVTIKKHAISITKSTDLNSLKFRAGDQIKINLELENIIDWEENKNQVKEFCSKNGLDLLQLKLSVPKSATKSTTNSNSLSTHELFHKYCNESKINPELCKYGISIITDEYEKYNSQ